jgi:hypothetical protein
MAPAQASVGSVGRFTDSYENISIDTCDSGYTPYTDGFLALVVGGSLDWFAQKPLQVFLLTLVLELSLPRTIPPVELPTLPPPARPSIAKLQKPAQEVPQAASSNQGPREE